MNAQVESWLSRRKWILVALGLPILVAAWWAFRPEKLWINEKVSEPAPFASKSDPQPRYTGLLEGKAHQTSGRATIYKTSDGKQNLKEEIVKGQLDSVELGSLKGNQGDQNYDLPTSVELQKYNAVVIYCERFHAVFGVARLEQF